MINLYCFVFSIVCIFFDIFMSFWVDFILWDKVIKNNEKNQTDFMREGSILNKKTSNPMLMKFEVDNRKNKFISSCCNDLYTGS